MESQSTYAELVERLIAEVAARPTAGATREVVFDREHHRYLLMKVGWRGHHRIHTCVLHLNLQDDKIWIEEDRTEAGIAAALLEAGVPKDAIVLAFHPPSERHLTEFAVG